MRLRHLLLLAPLTLLAACSQQTGNVLEGDGGMQQSSVTMENTSETMLPVDDSGATTDPSVSAETSSAADDGPLDGHD
jgi:hypothetical protein